MTCAQTVQMPYPDLNTHTCAHRQGHRLRNHPTAHWEHPHPKHQAEWLGFATRLTAATGHSIEQLEQWIAADSHDGHICECGYRWAEGQTGEALSGFTPEHLAQARQAQHDAAHPLGNPPT